MQELTKSVLTDLAVTAILVVLITPAPDELPCLAHKHLTCKAAVFSQAQLWLSVAIVSNVAPGYRIRSRGCRTCFPSPALVSVKKLFAGPESVQERFLRS
jgi:hypothetical protein